jgi:GrpB-like predicted nucleotidyltransferase (UPF0157 family)
MGSSEDQPRSTHTTIASVVVVDYDPAWPGWFAALSARIWPAVADLASSIEHVGSTSVPGLAAKPIIDFDIVVPSAERVPAVIERLTGLGYRHRGDLGVPGREAFYRPADGEVPPNARVPHQVYVCVAGIASLRNHLAVRDYLRANPAVSQEYGALKKELARRFPNDIDSYIEGKSELLGRILTASGCLTPAEVEAIRIVNRKPGDSVKAAGPKTGGGLATDEHG